jgi:CDP-6-deoxy-D-xylo-4-hexulose-3-dehydrase
MICCKDKDDYNIIKSLRSHGWSRGTSFENKIYRKNKNLDKRFIFFNSGYNLRPTEVSAAIGYNQFKKLDKLIKIRHLNRNKIINTILNNEFLKSKIDFFRENKNVTASWFGIPIKILTNSKNKKKIIYNLEKNGIETRPIISGNFAKQPACIKYGLSVNKKFPKTDLVYNNSFFIGLPTKKIGNIFLNKIIKAFEKSFK